jgi:hypothetical protein
VSIDYNQLAREYGLEQAFYPVRKAFKQLGVGRTFGYDLVRAGELKITYLSPRRGVIAAKDLARFLHSRMDRTRGQVQPSKRRAAQLAAGKQS